MNKLKLMLLATVSSFCMIGTASAADYTIDTKGAHASVNFKIKHLGYSWLTGRFNRFEGTFSYDKDKVSQSKISVTIDTTSIDTNHAEREKHLKSNKYGDFLKFAEAKFVSTSIVDNGNDTMTMKGDFTLHGVTKNISLNIVKIGEGDDPWGGYRVGFEGTTTITLKDFGYTFNLGPASQQVEITLNIEGVRQ